MHSQTLWPSAAYCPARKRTNGGANIATGLHLSREFGNDQRTMRIACKIKLVSRPRNRGTRSVLLKGPLQWGVSPTDCIDYQVLECQADFTWLFTKSFTIETMPRDIKSSSAVMNSSTCSRWQINGGRRRMTFRLYSVNATRTP